MNQYPNSILPSQIVSRFKYYNLFLIASIVCLAICLPASVLYLSEIKNFNNFTSPTSIFVISLVISQLFTFACFAFLITKTVFQSMLIHAIFNLLRQTKESKINPTLAVWTQFIPFYAVVMYPFNFLQAYRSCNISNQLPVKLLLVTSIIGIINELTKWFVNVLPTDQKLAIYYSLAIGLTVLATILEYVILLTLKNESLKQVIVD
jgi:hypothetical protein